MKFSYQIFSENVSKLIDQLESLDKANLEGLDATDEFEQQNILFGIDPNEDVVDNSEAYQKASEESQNILDFSYYYMGDKAFLALIDIIEEETGIQAIKLQGNNLTDKCVVEL